MFFFSFLFPRASSTHPLTVLMAFHLLWYVSTSLAQRSPDWAQCSRCGLTRTKSLLLTGLLAPTAHSAGFLLYFHCSLTYLDGLRLIHVRSYSLAALELKYRGKLCYIVRTNKDKSMLISHICSASVEESFMKQKVFI